MSNLPPPPFNSNPDSEGKFWTRFWRVWLREIVVRINERLTDILGTTNEITVVDNGDSTRTVSLPDAIKLDGATASRLLATDSGKLTTSVADLTTFIAGVANETDVTDDGSGGVIVGIVDPLIVAKGGTGVASLADHALVAGSGTGPVTALAVAGNGEIPIGSVGADPVPNAIDGTTNQVNVTNGAGAITLSTPQDIHREASPTFLGLNIVCYENDVVCYENGVVFY